MMNPEANMALPFRIYYLKTPNNVKINKEIFNDLWHRMLYLQNWHTANTNNIN